MKYLKLYEDYYDRVFIKDCFQDLIDDGFEILVSPKFICIYRIGVDTLTSTFKYEDIRECLLFAVPYLKDEFDIKVEKAEIFINSTRSVAMDIDNMDSVFSDLTNKYYYFIQNIRYFYLYYDRTHSEFYEHSEQKLFSESIDTFDSIMYDMRDILLDISDLGFEVLLDSDHKEQKINIEIELEDDGYFEPSDDFISPLERLVSFAISEGFKYSIYTVFDYDLHNTYVQNTLRDINTDGLINSIKIRLQRK